VSTGVDEVHAPGSLRSTPTTDYLASVELLMGRRATLL